MNVSAMFGSLVLFWIGYLGVFYVSQYRRNAESSRFPDGWKPPLRCVLHDHKWEKTGFGLFLVENTLMTLIERCKVCRLGRVLTLQGPRFYHPKELADTLARTQAVDAGNVTPMVKAKRSPSSRPLPPSA